jgi:hypothetical protein
MEVDPLLVQQRGNDIKNDGQHRQDGQIGHHIKKYTLHVSP